MQVARTALAQDSLSAAVQRATAVGAPLPARTALAKGLLPMGPTDLCVALYQLTFDAESTVRDAATKTAAELPERILLSALSEALHPFVLDFYAEQLRGREPLLEPVVLNPATDAQTICRLTRDASERLCELIAVNEDRLLRAPEILEALYFNRNARMSTVDRLIDLAGRHGLVVASIPSLRKEQDSSPTIADASEFFGDEVDQLFRSAVSVGDDVSVGVEIDEPRSDEEDDLSPTLSSPGAQSSLEALQPEAKNVQLNRLPISSRIRLATIGNAFHRSVLIQDTNRTVAMAAIRSPAINENEVVRYSSLRSIDEDIIRYIGERKEWLRLYTIKRNLVNNPKCPLTIAVKLLPHLRPNDLRAIARSKNVPAVIAKAAKQRLIVQTK